MQRLLPWTGLLAAIGIATPAAGGESVADHPWIGREAPSISLPAVNGKPVDIADYRGKKYVVIHFAASW